MSLGIGLLQVPTGGGVLMGEVPQGNRTPLGPYRRPILEPYDGCRGLAISSGRGNPVTCTQVMETLATEGRITLHPPYRGTSLIANFLLPGLYSRTVPRVLRWSY